MSDELTKYRRRLPHWRMDGAVYFVTWRLAPGTAALSGDERDAVGASLRYFNRERYTLLAYVVMNDHVHVLLQPAAGVALEAIVYSWKRFTALRFSRSGRQAPVWQAEYFDRIMRDGAEIAEKVEYIVNNPAKRWPGLVSYPWVWIDREALE